MEILTASVIIFFTQLVFIGSRTWNVLSIGKLNTFEALISGGIVHSAWLVSIAIGGMSMHKIIQDGSFSHFPIVVCSMIGGLYGTYLALEREKKKVKQHLDDEHEDLKMKAKLIRESLNQKREDQSDETEHIENVEQGASKEPEDRKVSENWKEL